MENSIFYAVENIEGVEENQTLSNKRESLDKLCATLWTIRARRFQKICTHYRSIQQLLENVSQTLTRAVRARMVGCQGQMITLDFYFGLSLGQTLYNPTDNFSKSLQSESLSAVSGHDLTLLTRDIIVNMSSDEIFKIIVILS